MESHILLRGKVTARLAAVLSICGLAVACWGAPEGSEQTDPWLIRIAAFRLVGASSLQSSSLGIALVGLEEVTAEVIVTDSQDRPYTGNVEVVLAGGEFEKGVVNRVFAVKDGRLNLSFRPSSDEVPFLVISLRVPGVPGRADTTLARSSP